VPGADLESVALSRKVVAGLLAALAGLLTHDTPLDLRAFSGLGGQVLAGHFDEAYAGTFTQAGPLQLVLSRLLLIGGHQGVPAALPRVVVDVALVLGAMATARGRAGREVAVAVLALLWLLGPAPWSGHPIEVAVPVLWAYAMVSSPGRSPVALAVSVLIAPLAVLGFPCLLAVARPMRAARTALVALGIAALGYLPFAVSGRFGMFGHVWAVGQRTLPHLLGLHEVTWVARLGQAVVVAGGCGLVALLLRGRPVAVAAAPLAAALLRVATDPLNFDYYWVPVAVGSVLLVALLPDEAPIWPAAVAGYATVMAATTDQAVPGALACAAAYLVVLNLPARLGGCAPGRNGPRSTDPRRESARYPRFRGSSTR
jgi:hypothetical protein